MVTIVSRLSTHFVGRCALYSHYCLDLLIWWKTTGNNWNPGQPAWPKPDNAKSPIGDEIQPIETLVGFGKCYRLQTLWSSIQHCPRHWRPIPLLRCWNGSLDRCMMNSDDCLRCFIELSTNWCWISSIKKIMHSQQMTLHDMFKQ